MKKLPGVLVAFVAIPFFAAQHGTPAEAKALLAKAVTHYKEVGRTRALADFNRGKPPWVDRDLYVVCFDAQHTVIAHGAFPSLVGGSTDILKDVNGRSVGKAGWDVAMAKGSGSVEYRMINPLSHKVEPKVSFFQKAGDDVCGVGAYNPK